MVILGKPVAVAIKLLHTTKRFTHMYTEIISEIDVKLAYHGMCHAGTKMFYIDLILVKKEH